MINVSICVAESANKRKESRGAHVRLDYPQRDDKNWLKNIVIKKDKENKLKISLRPVNLTELQPS